MKNINKIEWQNTTTNWDDDFRKIELLNDNTVLFTSYDCDTNYNCPLCRDPNYQYWQYECGDDLGIPDNEEDEETMYQKPFCNKCGIIYYCGCKSTTKKGQSNSHLISKWKDKTTNEVYVGMPQFESPKEWLEKVETVEVLEYVCPATGTYSKTEYAQCHIDSNS